MKLNEPRASERSRWSKDLKETIYSSSLFGSKKVSETIYIPSRYFGEGTMHKIPTSAFMHKIYPTCVCGRRFVRMKHIKGCDKKCFWCVFQK